MAPDTPKGQKFPPVWIFFVGMMVLVTFVAIGVRFLNQPVIADLIPLPPLLKSAIVEHTMKKDEMAATPTPLSSEAIAAVTSGAGQEPEIPIAVPAPLSSAASQTTFPEREQVSSYDFEGVIELIDRANQFIHVKDAKTGTVHLVAVTAATKITQTGSARSFAAFEIAHIVHVLGAGDTMLVNATSIAITSALPTPPAF